jgi:hypothetical protein
MSATTIEVPAKHIGAIRESLAGRHGHTDRRDEIDSLLAQLAKAPAAEPAALTGSRAVLWSVIYDSLCAAAEQLAEDCNEYWRGDVTPELARTRITDVSARLELLIGLGAPPRG